MKRLIYLLTFLAFAFTACEEIAPVVTGSMGQQGPVPPTDQKRQVLIEEFTGVRCINCPNGSIIIEELLASHSSRLVAISVHSGQFSMPYPESQFDFRTTEGDNILNYVGQPFGYPSAVVNRKKFDNQFDLQLGQNEWAGYIAEELALPVEVKIDIQSSFNSSSRNAAIDITLFIEKFIDEPDVRLSVIFTESDIVDAQLTPSSSPNVDTGYKHKHVFRGMATPFDGTPLTGSLVAGTQVAKSYNYPIPADWNEDNVNIIVVVSLAGDTKDVIQAHEVHLVE